MSSSFFVGGVSVGAGLLRLLSLLAVVQGWTWTISRGGYSSRGLIVSRSTTTTTTTTTRPTATRLYNNMFTDLGDMMTGGKLVDQSGTTLAYGTPLGDLFADKRTLAIQERAISFTGEDFDIFDIDGNQPYANVRGAMLHLPGKDKMRLMVDGQRRVTLDRKLMSMTPTYDIYRGDGDEKIGWLEKVGVALTDTFEFHAQQQQEGGFGPFKPPAAFKLEGDFLDRRFVMKNAKGEVVAKVAKDQLIEFDQFNHYQLEIASGMDPVLVVACACAIDEEFDEEHKKRKEQEAGS